MKRLPFSLILLVIALSFPLSADQISGFNYATDPDAQTDWVVTFFNSGVDSGSIATSTSDKKEGASSLKMIYNYHGNEWYYMKITKTFPAPIDLSSAKRFSMWLKGDPSADGDCLWYIRFYSQNGRVLRYVHRGALGVDGTWKLVSFDLIDTERDPFVGSYADCITLTDIENVEIVIEQQTGNTNSGTATLYFDDLQFHTDNDYIGIGEIDYFEYPSSAELQAEWSVTLPSTPSGFALTLSSSSTAIEGAKSMLMDVTLVSNWLNIWAFKTFDTPQDFTDIKFYMLWIKGDPANIGSRTPTLMFYLEDQDVHRLIAKCNSALKKDGWTCYFFDADYDSDGNEDTTNATFWQDKWDTAGDCDITKIKKLAIAIQDNQGTAGPSYGFSVLADGLVSGVRTSGPPPTIVRAAWCLYE